MKRKRALFHLGLMLAGGVDVYMVEASDWPGIALLVHEIGLVRESTAPRSTLELLDIAGAVPFVVRPSQR